jgi:L-lactate utilization protein LutC
LHDFSWSPEKSFVFGKNDGFYLTGINIAQAAVAQTGAFVLFNRSTNPSSISFLSCYHVVLLYEADIVESMTDVWDMVMQGKHAIYFISEPSSTADIGGLLLTGVHGPETLSCFIIRSEKRDNPISGKPT